MNPAYSPLVEQIRVNFSNRPTSRLPVLSFDKLTVVGNAKYIGD